MSILKISNWKEAVSKEQLTKSFKVVELKQYLRDSGLKVSGKKAILVERLFDYLENQTHLKQNQISIEQIKQPSIINIFEFVENKRKKEYAIEDILVTLQYYKLKSKGSYKLLTKRLYDFGKLLINYKKKYLLKVTLIQQKYKNHLTNRYQKYMQFTIKDCVNEEDFLTFDDLTEIPKHFVFIYKDTDNLVYGFDIRSLVKFMNQSKKHYNPYNNKEISKETKQLIVDFYYLAKLKAKKKKILVKEDIQKLPDMIREKAITVFQIMNVELNNYVDVNWFLNLNRFKLKKLYRNAEDIWNYRAQHLTTEIRKKHIPNNDAFKLPVNDFYKLVNIYQMRNIILDEFKKFITEGETVEECKTGAMWMLTALVEVSVEACNAMPWLLQ